MEKVKPIHKFNGGTGATLCNNCRAIIAEGLTEQVYCKKCKDEKSQTLQGTMTKVNETWLVYYREELMGPRVIRNHEYQLHPDSVKELKEMEQIFDNYESRILANPIVNFKLVKEGENRYALIRIQK